MVGPNEAGAMYFPEIVKVEMKIVATTFAFKICKFHMFQKSCDEFQQNQNDGEAKG